jgi:hypothetical protein
MMFQHSSSAVVPSTLRRARVRMGNQAPRAADSATVISVASTQWRLGQRRICPGVTGAMSRNAITSGVDRTGYADPSGVVRTLGSVAGGMESAIMQNGQGILKVRT